MDDGGAMEGIEDDGHGHGRASAGSGGSGSNGNAAMSSELVGRDKESECRDWFHAILFCSKPSIKGLGIDIFCVFFRIRGWSGRNDVPKSQQTPKWRARLVGFFFFLTSLCSDSQRLMLMIAYFS